MENYSDEEKTMEEEPLLESKTRNGKGGFKTLPFIIGNESLQKMATMGLSPNMTLYLMEQYHMEMITASNLLFVWSSATNFFPLLGAIIADSFLGRFYTIGFGSAVCLMGIILLWTTAIIPQARPPPCDQYSNGCNSPTVFQFLYLCASLGLISIGSGGVSSSSLAFGANQLEKGDCQNTSGVKGSYFSWCYASYTLAVILALTVVVYIQENMGWGVGFAVPVVFLLFGNLLFFLASPFYVKFMSKASLLTGLIQVAVVSYRNRHIKLPPDSTNVMYHYNNGSDLVCPSGRLRFLNKACIVKDPEKDLSRDGRALDPWSVCTVDQVEELKSLLSIIPLWSTGMIMSVNISQSSFQLLQAKSMNRHIGPGFTIPAASFSMLTVISVILWVALYHIVFLPLASRIKGAPVRISAKTRMGLGIFFSFLAMMAAAIIESFRRALATTKGYPQSGVQMSALWLLPQHCLSGFAEASNIIAQNEFYFSEFPRSMLSIASSLNGFGMSLASLLASFMLIAVDTISKGGGDQSWISSDINEGHYDYYYLVLAALSLANLIYFIICSNAYGPLKSETKLAEQEDS